MVIMKEEELNYRVLKLLEQRSDYTQRQLADELGLSLGKTHYLIKALSDVGWVKFENFQKSDNKWRYLYLLTPTGLSKKAAITAQFLSSKKLEYKQLRQEIIYLQKELEKSQEQGL